MKKILFLLLAMPLLGLSQTKDLIETSRYFPKSGKWQAFEKAVSAHAKKYHKGDYAWRVFSIETGPDAGGYMVVEGANNWTAVEARGDLGAAHMADWDTSVEPLLENRTSRSYYRYLEDRSTVPQKDYAEKISIQHSVLKPGWIGEFYDHILEPSKKVWQADGMKMAVYSRTLSGPTEVIVVRRYTDGLKVMDERNPDGYATRFKKANSDAAWTKWLEVNKGSVERQWSELLFGKPQLGSN